MANNIGFIFDGVMGIVLIFFLYRGLVKGFSGEIVGLVGLSVSTYCAWHFLDPAVEIFFRYVKSPAIDKTMASLICGLVIFFGVEIIFALIDFILSYVVKVTKLSFIDHFFGMIVGLLKTFCIVVLIYAIVSTFSNVLPSDWIESSYSMKGASYVWPYIRDFLQAHQILDFSTLTGGM